MADFDFDLEESAPAPSPAAGAIPGIRRSIPDAFGFGLDAPFRRGANDFVAVGGVDLINASISQILNTRAGSDYTTGELPWRSSFGSLLHLLRHQPNDAIRAELAKQYVVDALSRWERRIRVTAVGIRKARDEAGNESILEIRIRYKLRNVRNAETLETSVAYAV